MPKNYPVKYRTPHPSCKNMVFKNRSKRVLVRLGASSKSFDNPLRRPFEINSLLAIAENSDKQKMKEKLVAAGVKTTESYFNTPENRQIFKEKAAEGKNWNGVVFKKRNHRRSIGMEFLPTTEIDKLADAKYNGGLIERRINIRREWRVHYAPAVNKYFAVEKRRRNDAAQQGIVERNLDTCVFRLDFDKPEGWETEALPLCKKAVEAVGLDIAAIDLALSSGGIFYIIEVNSGPGLGELTHKWYNETIEELIDYKIVNNIRSNA